MVEATGMVVLIGAMSVSARKEGASIIMGDARAIGDSRIELTDTVMKEIMTGNTTVEE